MATSLRKGRISPLTAILGGGLTAAALDIIYAFVFFGLRGADLSPVLLTLPGRSCPSPG